MANGRWRKPLHLTLALALASCQTAQQPVGNAQPSARAAPTAAPRGGCARQVFWGDTHVHTMNSGDAILNGVRLTPEDALRFASGQQVRSSLGLNAQLARPLDFLVVTDHSELIGTGRAIFEARPELMADPTIRRWNGLMRSENRRDWQTAALELIGAYSQGRLPAVMNADTASGIVRSTWDQSVATVERYNQPGRFTAFIGYEYTSLPRGNNLHRNVIFRDGAATLGNTLPFSAVDNPDPERLWDYLGAYEQRTGGRALTIPHNGNLSNGLMYSLNDFSGHAMTADYAVRRNRWEPIMEATQIKGDGETHPILSPDDEFAGFGTTGWDVGNLDNSAPKTNDMLIGEYARAALRRGMQIEQRLGANPFKYGMIGSTDTHTGLSTADEDNFWGKFVADEDPHGRAESTTMGRGRIGWQYLAGGYAGVWASENTREALFDAMMRREVYATTGPRMRMRMFAGYDLADRDLSADPCSLYRRAVAMGGDLAAAPAGRAPRLLVSVLKDPVGANLDRVQIVKGWVDANGESHERVYDVAWSDPQHRRPGSNGRLPAVGNTVDLATATYRNSIGAAELRTVWTDPQFDPSQRAFYYVRALEIPTPRWPAYDAARVGSAVPEGTQLIAQERIYGSPVWYTPARRP